MINYTQINLARTFAQQAQKDIEYAGGPYDVHNQEVGEVLKRFGYNELSHPALHVAKHLHDVFEDTDMTPMDAVKAGIDPAGVRLAELVTDEPGETRKERKIKTYPKIASEMEAITLKLCDRIANVERDGKFSMYRQEYPEFKKALYQPKTMDKGTKRMWRYLDTILN